jgi:hypothetical protein
MAFYTFLTLCFSVNYMFRLESKHHRVEFIALYAQNFTLQNYTETNTTKLENLVHNSRWKSSQSLVQMARVITVVVLLR